MYLHWAQQQHIHKTAKGNYSLQRYNHSSLGHSNILHHHTRQHRRLQQSPTERRQDHHPTPPNTLHRHANQTRNINKWNQLLHHHYTKNHHVHMPTHMCHSAIRNHRGKKGGRDYLKNFYKKLKDGVHGTKETWKLWTVAIEGVIRNNHNTKDRPLSPKRAWSREKTPSTKFLNKSNEQTVHNCSWIINNKKSGNLFAMINTWIYLQLVLL